MISPVKRFSTFRTNLSFLSRMHYVVSGKMFIPFESFGASVARVRPLVTVTQLMPIQMLFSFQASATDNAYKSSFDFVIGQMLF